MTSVVDDYGEDWEEEEPSVSKEDIISAAGEHDTRDAEPTQVPVFGASVAHDPGTFARLSRQSPDSVKCTELKAKPNEDGIADANSIRDKEPTPEVEDGRADTMDLSDSDTIPNWSGSVDPANSKSFLDLVRIHGQHYGAAAPPIPFKVSTINNTSRIKSPPKLDLGTLQARVAAKRVVEFRKRQALKEEEERALQSSWAQIRREIRRSNDAMYKELGVAGLSAQDHLRIAQRRRKTEAKKSEIAASLERRNRWYHNIPQRTTSASDHIREVRLQYCHAKREQKRMIELKQKSIQLNQRELSLKAHSIIAKKQGRYVRGSYLLKDAHPAHSNH
ncbi:unnamed protein product [Phytophthora fragariaefolia]|uniref:Unnamed protein product n=1 Tax=Phytophthora fragariaefolia TaxID=1490495 RepID=A0A9W7D4R0_9STRA|nr:unnamed protein product [Phytophthora fragariaefolia]